MTTALVNDWTLARRRTGIGQYLASLIAHWPADATVKLVGAHSGLPWFSRRGGAERFTYPSIDSLRSVRLVPLASLARAQKRNWPPKLPLARRAWNAVNANYLKWRRRPSHFDLFFEPNHIPPADLRPTIATLHDLSVLEVPHFHPRQRVDHWRRKFELGVSWTTHWICVSQATAAAVHRLLGIPEDRLSIVPLASRWPAPPSEWTTDRVRLQLRLPPRYTVCLGTIEPRKNTLRLLDALAALPASWRRANPLILIGVAGWGDPEFWSELGQHPMAQEVLTTSYVDDATAAGIVLGARTMLYPSLYEGFGLPPLEAMTLSVPVAASTVPSLIEVCDSAATLIDPGNTQGWADAMMRLGEDGRERDELIERGRRRAAVFSWQATAQQHHDLFARIGGVNG